MGPAEHNRSAYEVKRAVNLAGGEHERAGGLDSTVFRSTRMLIMKFVLVVDAILARCSVPSVFGRATDPGTSFLMIRAGFERQ